MIGAFQRVVPFSIFFVSLAPARPRTKEVLSRAGAPWALQTISSRFLADSPTVPVVAKTTPRVQVFFWLLLGSFFETFVFFRFCCCRPKPVVPLTTHFCVLVFFCFGVLCATSLSPFFGLWSGAWYCSPLAHLLYTWTAFSVLVFGQVRGTALHWATYFTRGQPSLFWGLVRCVVLPSSGPPTSHVGSLLCFCVWSSAWYCSPLAHLLHTWAAFTVLFLVPSETPTKKVRQFTLALWSQQSLWRPCGGPVEAFVPFASVFFLRFRRFGQKLPKTQKSAAPLRGRGGI